MTSHNHALETHRSTNHAPPLLRHDAATHDYAVILSKGLHRWVFSCDVGDEEKLIQTVRNLAQQAVQQRGTTDGIFDALDAALVCQQIRKRSLPGLGAPFREHPAQIGGQSA